MQVLNQSQLNDDIGIIELFHGRLGNDLAKSMAYHTGNFWYIKHLNTKNILVSKYVVLLQDYDIVGDTTINNKYNVLTESDIQAIIDHSYRLLEPYNT